MASHGLPVRDRPQRLPFRLGTFQTAYGLRCQRPAGEHQPSPVMADPWAALRRTRGRPRARRGVTDEDQIVKTGGSPRAVHCSDPTSREEEGPQACPVSPYTGPAGRPPTVHAADIQRTKATTTSRGPQIDPSSSSHGMRHLFADAAWRGIRNSRAPLRTSAAGTISTITFKRSDTAQQASSSCPDDGSSQRTFAWLNRCRPTGQGLGEINRLRTGMDSNVANIRLLSEGGSQGTSYYQDILKVRDLARRLSVIGTKRSSSRFTSMVTVAKRSVSNLA